MGADVYRKPGRGTRPRPQRIRTPEENGVPDTPEARAHMEHALELREVLGEYGIRPEMVAPTRDGSGLVRLTFAELETLIYEDDDELEGE